MRVEVSDMKGWASLTLLVQKRLEARSDPFVVTFGEEDRTLEQNKLLHAIFMQCSNKAGAINPAWKKSANFWKTELKEKLGKKEVHFSLDEVPTVITVSTTKYNKQEVSDFIEKIREYMARTYKVQITLEGEIE